MIGRRTPQLTAAAAISAAIVAALLFNAPPIAVAAGTLLTSAWLLYRQRAR